MRWLGHSGHPGLHVHGPNDTGHSDPPGGKHLNQKCSCWFDGSMKLSCSTRRSAASSLLRDYYGTTPDVQRNTPIEISNLQSGL